jgi:glycyl-tRNA synthetase beta subunit
MILPAFARCVRITRDQKQTFRVDEKAFQEKEEEKLYAAIRTAEASIKNAGGSRTADIDALLGAFLPMMPAINAFFDKVLVMAEDRSVRENRLALLQRVAKLQSGVVDLSKLEGF